jgi:hypothetical protein
MARGRAERCDSAANDGAEALLNVSAIKLEWQVRELDTLAFRRG